MAPTVLLEHNDLPEIMTKLKQDMYETASKRERDMVCQSVSIVLLSNMHLITWSLRSDSTHLRP